MKKILTLLVIFLSMYCDGICKITQSTFSGSQVDGERTIREIRIDVFTIGGGKPRPRPRSFLPVIEAELDLTLNQLFLEFNEAVGQVAISVNNSIGQVVSSYSCDSALESIVILGIIDTPDSYTISIKGDEIEASGFYELLDY